MLRRKHLNAFAWLATVLWAGSAGAAVAPLVPKPTVSWAGAGEYVIDYEPCAQCIGDGIQEFRDETQSWEYAGSGPRHFGPRLPGAYRYRVAYAYESQPGFYELAHGETLTVFVDSDQIVSEGQPPSLAEQFAAEFSVRSGDIEGDGHRDLLIRRVRSEPNWGAGPISEVLLRQDSQGSLSASIPSAYQLALAESWVAAPIEIRKRDINIDGYVDLVLRGLAESDGFAGVANQILFAPGDTSAGQPGVLAADPGLARFSRDINRHLIDPEHYPNNVPYSYALVVYYTVDCGWYGYTGYTDYFFPRYCYYEPHVFVVAYQDFSGFDPDAIAIASADYGMIHGYESFERGFATIASILEAVLDARLPDPGSEILSGVDPSEADPAVRRGIALFSALAGISEAAAQEADSGAAGPAAERVLLKGRRVLGQGPFHTVLEFRYSTISAYDTNPHPLYDGLLYSEVDWSRDHPSLTLRLGYVDGPGTPAIYWGDLLAADGRYGDDLRYDLFPSLGEGGYNSNSYSSGLIQATGGLSTVQMATFVGGERPVPATEFD